MIAAAGSGRRLGAGGPKAFVELAGRPLLAHALLAAAGAASARAAVVAVPAADVERARNLASALGLEIEVSVCEGGASRAESVRAALTAVETEVVIVHDAARPLARAATFDRLTELIDSDPALAGAIAAAPVADTLKRERRRPARPGEAEAEDEAANRPGGAAVGPEAGVRGRGLEAAPASGDRPEVEATLPRDGLWAAQTPQAFRLGALRDAQARARERDQLEAATDEASLVEAAGGRVAIEPVAYPNLKITVPEDLRTAAALLDRFRGV